MTNSNPGPQISLGLKLLLFLALLALPSLALRWWYVPGPAYSPPPLSELTASNIIPPPTEYQAFADDPIPGTGHIVLDLAHDNNLTTDDLAPLTDRLTARGATVERFDGFEESLEQVLRGASAYVVLAPTVGFYEDELALLEDFVADGGRLLLAADPTRPVYPRNASDSGDLFDFFFPISGVPIINSLAQPFNIIYYEDYLYNLYDNAGNYRNVRLLPGESGLVNGLDNVTFFAAHSLRSNGPPLLYGDENTRSPLRTGESELAAATLTPDGRVLALGDMTFLTPGYHPIGDNNAFLSRIANWLAEDSRQRDIEDFPFLFSQNIDLVQAADGFLDPRLIARTSELQDRFQAADRTLSLRAEPLPGHDALYVSTFSTFAEVESLQGLFETAGLTVTVSVITDDLALSDADPLTDTDSLTDTADFTFDETDDEAADEDEAADTDQEQVIEIAGLGRIGTAGTTLFVVNQTATRTTVIALGEDGSAALSALERLTEGDFSGCVLGQQVTLCSTGERQAGSGLEGDDFDDTDDDFDDDFTPDDFSDEGDEGDEGDADNPFPDDLSNSGLSIFILSGDAGPDGLLTSALAFETILSEEYNTIVWSLVENGVPSEADIADYDAYILTYGDYAYDDSLESLDALAVFFDQEKGTWISGAQSFPQFDDQDPAPIFDLTVVNNNHPVTNGLSDEQLIALDPSASGVPAIVIPPDITEDPSAEILLVRGPESDFAGQAVFVATSTDETDRALLSTMAFYRLPPEVQEIIALNTMAWLLNR